MISKLYISSKNRDENLKEFFANESEGCLPSLSHVRKLQLGMKSYMLPFLDNSYSKHLMSLDQQQ